MNERAHCSYCDKYIDVGLLFFVKEETGSLHLYLCEECNNNYIQELRQIIEEVKLMADRLCNDDGSLSSMAEDAYSKMFGNELQDILLMRENNEDL